MFTILDYLPPLPTADLEAFKQHWTIANNAPLFAYRVEQDSHSPCLYLAWAALMDEIEPMTVMKINGEIPSMIRNHHLSNFTDRDFRKLLTSAGSTIEMLMFGELQNQSVQQTNTLAAG